MGTGELISMVSQISLIICLIVGVVIAHLYDPVKKSNPQLAEKLGKAIIVVFILLVLSLCGAAAGFVLTSYGI